MPGHRSGFVALAKTMDQAALALVGALRRDATRSTFEAPLFGRLERAAGGIPAQRPDKRERRLIHRFRERNES